MISEAFPDFNLATLPPIPSDWRDVSWHHDENPSWQIDGLLIYIGAVSPRYHVIDADTNDVYLATDAWADVLNLVRLVRVALPAIEPDQDEEALTRVYDQFLAVTGLPAMSADELLFENIPATARQWLTRFIEAWEEMRADERDWMQYANQKAGIK